MERHDEIINGILSVPAQIMDIFGTDDEMSGLIEGYWSALWHSFLNEDGVSGIYWANAFRSSGYEKEFTRLNYLLQKFGWISMEISQGFCAIQVEQDKLLKWVSKQEIKDVRRRFKLAHYKMHCEPSKTKDLVKIGNGYQKTGLVREGFAKAGNCRFGYDSRIIRKYQKEITEEVSKKLIAGIKDVQYKSVVIELIAEYASEDLSPKYTLGKNISDSRGRAIFDCTRRVFNPISHKTARACMVLPKAVRLTNQGEEAIAAFVAEINGFKGGTWEMKVARGRLDMEERFISDSLELHEKIWIERIYDNIDRYTDDGWDTPIEVDMTACGIGILGVLTNDHSFMNGTNIIGEKLEDIWTVPGLTRNMVKKAITPILYGSSQTPNELWDMHDYPYTQKQINIINHELFEGKFRNILGFKEHVIGKVQPKESMNIKLWNDEFTIFCNKFKWGVMTPQRYGFLDAKGRLKNVIKETEMTPDLQSFKLYFATLCLHNIDSQIANHVCENMDWVIPVHDAFNVNPNEALVVRNMYVDKLRELYVNRKQILKDFCASIGIEDEYEDIDSKPVDVLSFSGHCLK